MVIIEMLKFEEIFCFTELKNSRPASQVIIAALNEEEGIGLTITDLQEHIGEAKILVVDGNSIDRTVEVAKDLGADILFQDGKGKGDAFAKGVENIGFDTKYVIVIDADFTYPAEHIPEMIELLEKNPEIGMISGNRFTMDLNSNALHNVFYFGNKLIAFAHTLLNGVPLKDPLTGLRVIRAEVLRDWKVKSKGFDMEVELNHRVERKGFGITEVPIGYRERVGKKKLGVKHGAEILKRIIIETMF
jgi:glycosyltransferase involved in cell wall biosynthesis